MALWNKETEKRFFKWSLRSFSPSQLFYQTEDGKYFAYWPKDYKGRRYTLQSRNALIGAFTGEFCRSLVQSILPKGFFAIQEAICYELGLEGNSKADLVIARSNRKELSAGEICLIFEVKMSIVWNWELKVSGKRYKLECIGDYKSHRGTPGILRSDSVLKAIGKCIDVRLSSERAKKIPLIVLANTHITRFYYNKVDLLKKYGLIQGFWSLNPKPLEDTRDPDNLKMTPQSGFYRFDNETELKEKLLQILKMDFTFFAGMLDKETLGKIIATAGKELDNKTRAEKFLELLEKWQ